MAADAARSRWWRWTRVRVVSPTCSHKRGWAGSTRVRYASGPTSGVQSNPGSGPDSITTNSSARSSRSESWRRFRPSCTRRRTTTPPPAYYPPPYYDPPVYSAPRTYSPPVGYAPHPTAPSRSRRHRTSCSFRQGVTSCAATACRRRTTWVWIPNPPTSPPPPPAPAAEPGVSGGASSGPAPARVGQLIAGPTRTASCTGPIASTLCRSSTARRCHRPLPGRRGSPAVRFARARPHAATGS